MEVLSARLLDVAFAILIALATSLITVRLSLKQFFFQKWWERKAEAYTDIIEAIYKMINHAQKAFDDELEYRPEREEELKQLLAISKEGKRELERVMIIGTFLVSSEVVKILEEAEKKTEPTPEIDTYLAWLIRGMKAYSDALKKIIAIAKKDLNVKIKQTLPWQEILSMTPKAPRLCHSEAETKTVTRSPNPASRGISMTISSENHWGATQPAITSPRT